MRLSFLLFLFSVTGLFAGENCGFHTLLQSPGPSSPIEYRAQQFDVLEYDLDIHIPELNKKMASGENNISVLWNEIDSGSRFYFHARGIYPLSVKYEDSELQFDSVYSENDYYYSVAMPEGVSAGDTVLYSIAFEGVLTSEGGDFDWGGVHYQDNVDMLYALGVGFKNSYVSATHHWMPCYDHPSDKAKFKASFKVPDSVRVASVGLLVSEDADGGNKIYRWEMNSESATYLLTFAASGMMEVIDYEFEGLPVNIFYYDVPGLREQSEYAYMYLDDMIRIFRDRFINYPFEKVGYVNTKLGAMEHQTLISMPNGVVSGAFYTKDSTNTTIAHELSHQWFGNLVSPLDFRHAWLNESFATFCESLWLEDFHNSREVYIDNQSKKLANYINQIVPVEGKLPLYDFSRDGNSSNYPQTIYQKGAVVLGMLRYEMGDTSFFGALKEYLQTYAFSNVTTGQLREILEKHHGENLDLFFDNYIYRSGFPELDIQINHLTPELTGQGLVGSIKIEQIQEEIFEGHPLHFNFVYEDEESEIKVNLIERTTEIEFDNPINFESFEVNKGPGLVSLCKIINLELITSVDENSSSPLIITPNPASGYFRIYNLKSPAEITIMNLYGEIVKTGNIQKESSQIEINFLPAGSYIVIVRSESGQKVLKLIKN
jgi:hypothetical protein